MSLFSCHRGWIHPSHATLRTGLAAEVSEGVRHEAHDTLEAAAEVSAGIRHEAHDRLEAASDSHAYSGSGASGATGSLDLGT